MKKFKLYNSLTRKKETFQPLDKNKIRVYSCGPTVYNYVHLGNLRSYVFADLLIRTLRYNFGISRVRWAMNITDLEDKTIRDSKNKYPDLPPAEALKKFTAEFEEYFWQDLSLLNVSKPDSIIHATAPAYIKKMQKLVKKIYAAGYAYAKDGSIYFDVAKYSQKNKYGRLVDLDISHLKAGVRINEDEYEKDNVQDFVLWKARKPGEPFWDFKINGENLPGRPGWHIECSAIGEAELGLPFDIHTGGVDLKFPHHENEIHQSVIGYHVKKPVNYWLHNEHLLIDGQRMGKRFNNFYTISDLEEKKINPLAYRFLCLQTGYGKVMNFTWEGLAAAEQGLEHLYNQVRELPPLAMEGWRDLFSVDNEYKGKFLLAINDDLNLPRALAVAQELLKSALPVKVKLASVFDFDRVLGLKLDQAGEPDEIPAEVMKLARDREAARQKKNWQEADRLRLEIEKLGYQTEDTNSGQRVIKKL